MSFLAGKGKKTAWEIWKLYPDLSPTLVDLSSPLPVLNDNSMATIERIALRQDQCSHRGKAQQAWPLFSVILKLISLLVLSQVTDVKKVSLLYIFFYFLGEQSKAISLLQAYSKHRVSTTKSRRTQTTSSEGTFPRFNSVGTNADSETKHA